MQLPLGVENIQTLQMLPLFAAREITIKKRNPANQEGTLINQFPDYQKIIDERQKNPQPEPPKK
jgi:hypothetical protein